MKVAPSLLAADFLNLEQSINKVSSADYLHLDVMDGTLVPNISFGFSVIDQLHSIQTPVMDAHLMVVHPERWFKNLAKDGVQMISFHLEAARCRTSRCIDEIHALGCKAGVAIDPDVPVKKLYKYIGKADFFVIMSVFAGFGGQKFIETSLDRVEQLKNEIKRRGADALVEVDGGVTTENAAALSASGADILVAGSAVFKSGDPEAAIAALKKV